MDSALVLNAARQALLRGEVIAAHGRHYLVQLADGEILTCFPRGKRSLLACGDLVALMQTASGQGVIEAVDPRRTLLYRSDRYRQKLIAANVSQMVIVLATAPSFYEELLNRCLVAAEHQRIGALIVLNKFDLIEHTSPAMQALELYRELGYIVLPLTAKQDVSPLRGHLQGRLSVLVGQSGMGKSTIINGLLPEVRAAIGEISPALDSGRHTTTHARLYRLDERSGLIDSPGLQEFGLLHLTQAELAHAFVEFRPHLGHCKFNDCQHRHEPGCAVAAARERGELSERRLRVYRRFTEELARARER